MDDNQGTEILSLRASGLVKRWHVITTLREQTVAEHSAQALSLLLLLHPDPSIRLIKAILWHDSSELKCGDVPSPVRRENPELDAAYRRAERALAKKSHPSYAEIELTLTEKQWLQAVDVLELWLHCHDETMLGNQHFYVIEQRAGAWLEKCGVQPVVEFVEWHQAGLNCRRSFA